MHGKNWYQIEDIGYFCIEKDENWIEKKFTESLIFVYYLSF